MSKGAWATVRLAALATALTLVVASAAGAATVAVKISDPDRSSQFAVATVAGGGEDADDVTVTWVDGTLEVTDATAALTAGDGCIGVDAHAARCARVSAVNVSGGAGDDRITVAGSSTGGVALDGGPGNDVLVGGPGDDQLTGGPGIDAVSGGGGGDEAYVVINDTGLEADTVDLGGTGTMHVDTRVTGVTLDLAAETLRVGQAVSSIRGARDATLGPARGTLLGTEGTNQLSGAGTVDGRGGDDRLSGFPGPDRLVGGDGDDEIDLGFGDHGEGGAGDDALAVAPEPGAAGKARIACGAGRDVAAPGGTATVVPFDCEQTTVFAGLQLGSPRRTRDGGVAVRATFPTGQCGLAAWARSSSGRRLTPRVQVRVGRRATAATLRLPVAATTRTISLAVYFPHPCPARKRWSVGRPTTTLLALPPVAAR